MEPGTVTIGKPFAPALGDCPVHEAIPCRVRLESDPAAWDWLEADVFVDVAIHIPGTTKMVRLQGLVGFAGYLEADRPLGPLPGMGAAWPLDEREARPSWPETSEDRSLAAAPARSGGVLIGS